MKISFAEILIYIIIFCGIGLKECFVVSFDKLKVFLLFEFDYFILIKRVTFVIMFRLDYYLIDSGNSFNILHLQFIN